jgi:hypothetical protein
MCPVFVLKGMRRRSVPIPITRRKVTDRIWAGLNLSSLRIASSLLSETSDIHSIPSSL